MRELDLRLGLTERVAGCFTDHRHQELIEHTVLEPVAAQHPGAPLKGPLRGDAAFARPEVHEFLEQEQYRYAIRLPASDVLQRQIEHLLTRPAGRPPNEPIVWYESFSYQAGTWKKWRRGVAKVEWHKDELFLRVGLIVTNLTWTEDKVVRLYNGRGAAEQWIKEGKNAVKWTRLSCRDFADNQVRL